MKTFISPAQSPTNFVGSWAGSETCSGTEHPGWTLAGHCTTPVRENAAVHDSKNCALMSPMGQTRPFGDVCSMSGLRSINLKVTSVKDVFIGVVALDIAIVSTPAHPFPSNDSEPFSPPHGLHHRCWRI